MSEIKELDTVVLETDLPDSNLKKGDIGTAVLIHGAGEGYEVEFMTLEGETVAVVTLDVDEVRGVQQGEIAHVRRVANA